MPDQPGDLLAALRALGDHIDDHGASTDPVAAAVRDIRAAPAPARTPAPASPASPPRRSRVAGRLSPGGPRARDHVGGPGSPRAGGGDDGSNGAAAGGPVGVPGGAAAGGCVGGPGSRRAGGGIDGSNGAPAEGRVGGPGGRRAGRPRGRRPVLVAAVALLVLVGLVAAPGPRGAVARLLGIGGVRLELSGQLAAGTPGTQGLGERIDVDAALDRAPGPLVPTGLGPPSAAFAGLPEGGVSLVWAARDSLPPLDPAQPRGPGVIVTAFPTGAGGRLDKSVSNIEAVSVGEADGLWISGPPHDVAVRDADGQPVPDTLRLARNALLWRSGGVTYRLESALGRDEAIALAESID
jgi:hypothetical protein